MPYRPPVAVYDACVLYPFHLRNILVQCAVDGLVEARWSDDIHAEWMRSLAAATPGLTEERLLTTRNLMKAALPEADVTDYARLIPDLRLPDPNDRHVLATAIAGGGSIIVTWNVRDFPAIELERHAVACQTPDSFLVRLHAVAPEAVIDTIDRARRNLRRTTPTIESFLEAVERQGLTAFSEILCRSQQFLRAP